MRRDYILSVTQLNEYVASLLGNDALLAGLSLRGEVSGFKRHTSGHLYFSMKDEGALVRCVMFRQNAMTLRREIRDGMQIVAKGYASLYARDGQFQFYVRSVEDEGEGELFQRFLRLKERLEATGMFDAAHKRGLPRLPRCVGVVTSPTGAAIQDITNVVRRRYPMMDIAFCPAQVQGEGAARDIAAAIRAVNRDGRADVLIVGRGGGSLEDLWAFNEEVVARAIYESDIPVVSAVGHETDFTIADFVADMRAPTPSAAAELCVPEYEAQSADVEDLGRKLLLYARRCVDFERAKLDSIRQHGAFVSPRFAMDAAYDALERLGSDMRRGVTEDIRARRNALDAFMQKLDALAPERILERGFALVRTESGAVGSIAELREGGRALVVMRDGSADVLVEKVNMREGK